MSNGLRSSLEATYGSSQLNSKLSTGANSWEAHHVVPQSLNDPGSKFFDEEIKSFLDEIGFDFDAEYNGVPLPKDDTIIGVGAGEYSLAKHGSHSDKYTQLMRSILEDAKLDVEAGIVSTSQAKSQIIGELKNVKKALAPSIDFDSFEIKDGIKDLPDLYLVNTDPTLKSLRKSTADFNTDSRFSEIASGNQFVNFDGGTKSKITSGLDFDKSSGAVGTAAIAISAAAVSKIAADALHKDNLSISEVIDFVNRSDLNINTSKLASFAGEAAFEVAAGLLAKAIGGPFGIAFQIYELYQNYDLLKASIDLAAFAFPDSGALTKIDSSLDTIEHWLDKFFPDRNAVSQPTESQAQELQAELAQVNSDFDASYGNDGEASTDLLNAEIPKSIETGSTPPIPSLPSIKINDSAAKTESASESLDFWVSLSEVADRDVTFKATTYFVETQNIDGVNQDYHGFIGKTFTIKKGDLGTWITISLKDDGFPERSELMNVQIHNASGASISDAWGVGRINDNDSHTLNFPTNNQESAINSSIPANGNLYYDFITNGSGDLAIKLDGQSTNTKLRVLDYLGKELHSSVTQASGAEVISFQYSDNQLYFIDVQGGSSSSNFQLSISQGGAVPPVFGDGKDLQITATDVSKTTWVDGESIDVGFTVVNTGDEDAARTNSGVYLSTNDNISTGDTLIYDESTGTMSAGEINGEGGSFTVDLSAWNLDPGTYWLGTIADINDEVDETNSSDTAEGNNDEYADANPIQITISDTTGSDNGPTLGGGRAAIELLSASLDRSVIVKGEAATVSYSVRNTGASTTDSVQQGFYVSTDQVFGNSDDIYLERDGAGHLSNGEIETDTDELGDLRSLDVGDYYLFVKADYDDKFAEDNESNNISAAIPFTVEPEAADLTVMSTSLSRTSFQQGESADLTYVVKNIGGSEARDFRKAVYLSQNPTFDDTAELIGGTGHGVLYPNGTKETVEPGSSELSELSELAPGDYYLYVFVDDRDVVSEGNESNNTSAAIPFTVEPAASEPVVQIIASDVTEASEVIFSLTLDYNPTNKDVVVNYRIEGGTATEGVDFENRPGQQSITLTSDTITKTIRVQTLPDGTVEPDETVHFIVDSVNGGTIEQTVHSAKILDDDVAGVLPELYFVASTSQVEEGGELQFYLSGDHNQLNGNYVAEGYLEGLTTDDVERIEVQFYGPNHNGDIWQLTHEFKMVAGAWTNTTTGDSFFLNSNDEPYVRFNLQKDYVAARPEDTKIKVYTKDDTLVEGDEEVMVRLEPYLSNTFVFEDTGFGFQRATLLDNDAAPGVLSIYATQTSVEEGDSGAASKALLFEVRREGGSDGEVTFDWIIQSGASDIADSNGYRGGTITFSDGDTNPRAIILYLPGDDIVESDSQVRVLISGVGDTQIDPDNSYDVISVVDNDTINTPAVLEYPFFISAPWLGPDGSDFGQANVGNELGVTDARAFSDADGIQYGSEIYQWYRNGTAIDGATSSSYVLTNEDVDTTLTVQLSFLDIQGNVETHTSDPISSISLADDGYDLVGDTGNNVLEGSASNESIYGDKGNDTINGGLGSDVYVFGADAGLDLVQEVGGAADVLRFEHVTNIEDLGLHRGPQPGSSWEGTLFVTHGENDQVEVKNQFASHGGHLVETLELGNGDQFTMHTGTTGGSNADVVLGRTVVDYLKGNGGNDFLSAGASDDALFGHGGDDILIGGTGDDALRGGHGADRYHIFDGDGADTIIEYDGVTDLTSVDQIIFHDVASLENMDIGRLSLGGSTWEGALHFDMSGGDSLTLLNHFASNGRYVVEELELGDGTTFAMTNQTTGSSTNDLLVGREVVDYLKGQGGDDYLIAGGNDDVLFGHSGNDTLIGETGNDTLRGGDGADRYVLNTGDGDDLIIEYDGIADLTSTDVIVFKDIDDINDLTLSRVAENGSTWAGSLLIEAGTDSVRVQHHFASNDRYKIENIELSDGSIHVIDDFAFL